VTWGPVNALWAKETTLVDIYLIRHADALQLGERGITQDSDRPLSERGLAQAASLAAGLQKRQVTLDLLLTSPLVRARQTAEEMLRHWSGQAPALQACDELGPDVKPRKLAKFLRGVNGSAVGLVGHQPDLGRHAGWLIGSKKAQVDLAKGGVACITFDGEPRKGSGTLVWLVTPLWLEDGASK
jgi:phosphohistidine phosphatase